MDASDREKTFAIISWPIGLILVLLLEPILCMVCYAAVWAVCGVVYILLKKCEGEAGI